MEERLAMRSTLSIANSLLDVDKEQTLALSPRLKLYASILALINLFPSGFSENALLRDSEGYHLSLFLFAHSVAYLLLALFYFIGTSKEILTKTKIFPTNSLSRIAYVVWSSMRHPFSIALLASNAFFFLILYRTNLVVSAAAIVLYLLLMVNISVIASVVFLFLENRNQSTSIAIVFVILFGFVSLVAVLAFRADSFAASVPLVGWCNKGIVSALKEHFAATITHALLLLLIPFAVVGIGKRIS
jgi:hypothetical protein